MRWTQGEATIHQPIRERRLQQVTGADADGAVWTARAARTLNAAQTIADVDADSAYVLAYDAARQACTALLVHQGLRPTTDGGHYVVEEVIRAQFGDLLRRFGTLRRRRNELEYLTLAGDRADPEEAAAAIDDAEQLSMPSNAYYPTLHCSDQQSTRPRSTADAGSASRTTILTPMADRDASIEDELPAPTRISRAMFYRI